MSDSPDHLESNKDRQHKDNEVLHKCRWCIHTDERQKRRTYNQQLGLLTTGGG